jgi:hypothetical protein
MLISCLVYSSILKTEATSSSETSDDFQRTTWCYIPEDITLRCYRASSNKRRSPISNDGKRRRFWRNWICHVVLRAVLHTPILFIFILIDPKIRQTFLSKNQCYKETRLIFRLPRYFLFYMGIKVWNDMFGPERRKDEDIWQQGAEGNVWT